MKNIYRFVVLTLLVFLSIHGSAQLNPSSSIYYQNPYLSNPAMAGFEKILNINTAYKTQWTNIDGAPKTQIVTADYGFNNKVGIGALFYNDKFGIFQQSKFMATYAYHLIFSKDIEERLSFGLSAGIMYNWIDLSKAKGDLSDIGINMFNSRPYYFDSDFGMVYSNDKVKIQLTIPNLKRHFKREGYSNAVDLSMLYAAFSYRLKFKDMLDLDDIVPCITYRQTLDYKDAMDIGSQFNFSQKRLMFNIMYRTSGNFTIGTGTTYKNVLTISSFYTTNTAALKNYTNGEFEVALKYSLITNHNKEMNFQKHSEK